MNLRRLRDDLRYHRFDASHASKIFIPKPSGLLRPITLLTVEDQIVYQACVNIIADRLKPITIKRYRKRVFNHLYAGKSSIFFYLKWQDSYRMFANTVRRLVNLGYVHAADFDLTSFYDTIDHNVLRHFLTRLDIEAELTDFLLRCLQFWTSSTWSNISNVIYHGHGIPQGPLSSGMLSEVVLMHMDETGERGRRTRYLRYVDDIKLFAKSEAHLRQKLIELDICSKEIGLFPQTSKINIHEVTDAEDEIKSISRPPETSIGPFGNQDLLRRRILEITRGGKVHPRLSTRFKYLLGRADPYYTLNTRLLTVLENQPEYSVTISYYFSRYKGLPHRSAQRIIQLLVGNELYHSVHGDLLRATLENMRDPERNGLANFCYQRLFGPPRLGYVNLPPQPGYKEALIAWVIRNHRVSFSEIERLRDDEVDWWVRKSIFRELEKDQFGTASFGIFLNDSLRLSEAETARCAAAKMIAEAVPLSRPYANAHLAGKQSLRAAGIIKYGGRPHSIVNSVLHYVLKRPQNAYDWRRFYGRKHRQAERIAVLVKQSFEADIDACMARMDSLCDLFLEELVSRLSPGSGYGYGSILNSPPAQLRAVVPNVISGFKALHDLRTSSITAHPRSLRTGAATRRLKHSDHVGVRPSLIRAFDEIESVITP